MLATVNDDIFKFDITNMDSSNSMKLGVFDLPGILDIESSGLTDGRCSMNGPLGLALNFFIEEAHKYGFNCTLRGFHEIGTYDSETKSYTELIGAVQRGVVDVSAIPVYYPLHDDDETFEYTPTVNEDEMMLVTFYNVTHSQQISDIIFMYADLPAVLWIGFFISFLIFACIVLIGQKITEPKLTIDPIWSTFVAFIDQDEYTFTYNDGRYSRFLIFLSLSISIFAFFISNLMNNSVGTDMVTIDKAYAPKSYKEMLDRNMKLGFNKMFPEYEKFRDSPKDSEERKIFESAIFFKLEPEEFIALKNPVQNQKIALVGRKMIAEAAGLGVVTLIGDQIPDGRALLTKDANAKRYTNVFFMNKNTNVRLKNTVGKVVYRIYEHGVIKFLYDNLPSNVISILIQPVQPSTRRKITPVVEQDEPQLHPVGIRNTLKLYQCFVALIIVSSIVLIAELCRRSVEKKKEKKMMRRVRRTKHRMNIIRNANYYARQHQLNAYYASTCSVDNAWIPAQVNQIVIKRRRRRICY